VLFGVEEMLSILSECSLKVSKTKIFLAYSLQSRAKKNYPNSPIILFLG
jgi:hypothetical protein